MNTHQAKYETALERMEKNMAERDKSNTRWMIGTIFAAAILIIAVVRLP